MKEIWNPFKVFNCIQKNGNIHKDIYITNNFLWSELFISQTDYPDYLITYQNLFNVTKILQDYRDKYFNTAITITSGYRSKSYNAKIGGAPNSYHTSGQAIDFLVKGLSPENVQMKLDSIHKGGLEYAPSWTHIDIRSNILRFDSNNKVYEIGEYFKRK
jgi:hypothetical protein